MKRLNLPILLLLAGTIWAQNRTPRTYYNRLNNEIHVFHYKSMNFYQTHLTESMGKSATARLKAVNEQLVLSRKRVESVPAYRSDAKLRDTYLAGLDSLIDIFENDFKKIENLKRYRQQSYKDLLSYYNALNDAEKRVKKAEEMLILAEEDFSTNNSMKLQRDTDRDLRYKKFEQINGLSRAMTLQFYKVDHQLKSYLEIIDGNRNLNLDTYDLDEKVAQLRADAEEALIEINILELEDFNTDFQKEAMAYMKFVIKQSNQVLQKSASIMGTEPYYSDNCRDIRLDLQFFEETYNTNRKQLMDTRIKWLKNSFADLK